MNKTMGLERFLDAQANTYIIALEEVKNGRKMSHWMWYIFPQIVGLGTSSMSQYYGIRDINEARAYLKHSVLSARLIEITTELSKLTETNPTKIFGSIDAMKLKSCMTLFEFADEEGILFSKVLNKFYYGERDIRTLKIVGSKSVKEKSL